MFKSILGAIQGFLGAFALGIFNLKTSMQLKPLESRVTLLKPESREGIFGF